ncbi:helix-turn-helix transcriptional regulator [Natronosalvus rutilus]|uniref:Helix-turn-helix domain-containing protein n=1 Tax=Natronosalvus rutilus TaxID=2953753 RepID=A0A9E7SWE7_9EURY|nr:MarR family transcriptional regulator [Natronosalvus rutilus]UTF53981.1 helix-turn-helix domain-containing protein [Natronosalvus rutilus]
MKLEEFKREHIREGTNVLVLSPLTPHGTKAFTELLSTTNPSRTNMAVVTYTQPPSMWLTDWEAASNGPPNEITFIHNGSEPGEEISTDQQRPGTINTVRASPQDPIDVVTHLGDELKRWQDEGRQSVISVQTLTILLEYIDFDTAFRYLHILIHRVQAAGAIGYYQMDPTIHDEETINTLSVLFDVVAEVSQTETGEDEWTLVGSKSRADVPHDHDHGSTVAKSESESELDQSTRERTPDVERHTEPRRDRDGNDHSPLTEFKTWVSSLWSGDGGDGSDGGDSARKQPHDRTLDGGETGPATNGSLETETDQPPRDAETEPPAPSQNGSNGTSESVEPSAAPASDDPLLTDQEQIQQLIAQSGGRMRQSDLVEETRWSSSSVSRKLSSMEEEGLITRVQVGRGNLVFLAGYEPDAAVSPSGTSSERTTPLKGE